MTEESLPPHPRSGRQAGAHRSVARGCCLRGPEPHRRATRSGASTSRNTTASALRGPLGRPAGGVPRPLRDPRGHPRGAHPRHRPSQGRVSVVNAGDDCAPADPRGNSSTGPRCWKPRPCWKTRDTARAGARFRQNHWSQTRRSEGVQPDWLEAIHPLWCVEPGRRGGGTVTEPERQQCEDDDGTALSRVVQQHVLESPEVLSFLLTRVADVRADPQPTLTREQFYAEFPD